MDKLQDIFKIFERNFARLFFLLLLLNLVAYISKSQVHDFITVITTVLPVEIKEYLISIAVDPVTVFNFFNVLMFINVLCFSHSVLGYHFELPYRTKTNKAFASITAFSIILILLGNFLSNIDIFKIGIVDYYNYLGFAQKNIITFFGFIGGILSLAVALHLLLGFISPISNE